LSDQNLKSQDKLGALLKRSFQKLKEVPLKYSLAKFNRVVKDIARSLGKKARFNLLGEQVSLSPEMVTTIQESLLHLIRNSLDHGLENPDHRITHGKDEMGTIEVNIEKKDGHIFITLQDDGTGIDYKEVLKKAITSGLINQKEAQKMTKEEAIELIFTPNLSTKEQISEISGRGVGMDVVKKNIDQIGGSIHITTTPGELTSFEIKIPYENF
jgi:two-component system, chemotaxis family, sensor kinase CheA